MSKMNYPTEIGWAEMADIAEHVMNELILQHTDEQIVQEIAELLYGRNLSDTQVRAIRMAVLNGECTPYYTELLKAEQGAPGDMGVTMPRPPLRAE